MAKIPAPPPLAKLGEIGADEKVIPSGMTFFRVYFRGSPHHVTWRTFRTYGPADARFDHHLRPPREQERGILYLAVHPRTALAEVFQRRRTINTRRMEPWLVGLETAARTEASRPDRSLANAGGRVDCALDRTPRADSPWSRAAYEAYPGVHGLWYGSVDGRHARVRRTLRARGRRDAGGARVPSGTRDPSVRAMLEQWAGELNYRLIL